MSSPSNIHILKDAEGVPIFAVIPHTYYLSLLKQRTSNALNSEVGKENSSEIKSIREWRLHFGLSHSDISLRLGISRNAYIHYEVHSPVKKSTRERVANALGVAPEHIDFSK